jgi:hypothetical protein
MLIPRIHLSIELVCFYTAAMVVLLTFHLLRSTIYCSCNYSRCYPKAFLTMASRTPVVYANGSAVTMEEVPEQAKVYCVGAE